MRRSSYHSLLGLICALGLFLLAGPALAYEFRVTPSIDIGEEYNDNIFETKNDRKTDFITRAQPGVGIRFESSRLDVGADYSLIYRHYAEGTRSDGTDNMLGAHALGTLIENLLFVNVSDTYQQIYSDVAKNALPTGDVLNNRVNQNVFTLSPYVSFKPTQLLSLTSGYRYVDTRYSGSSGTTTTDTTTGSSSGLDKSEHIGFVNAGYELTPKLVMNSGYTFTHLESEVHANDYNQHYVYVGPTYEYADKSTIYAQAGPSFTERQSGSETTNIFWSAGIVHNFDTFLASFVTTTDYEEDPLLPAPVKQTSYTGWVSKPFDRGDIRVSLTYTTYDSPDPTAAKNQFGGTIQVSRELTGYLLGTLGLAAEKREYTGGAHTTRYVPAAGLKYLLSNTADISLDYSYTDSSSNGRDVDSYQENKVILKLVKRFEL